MGISTVMFDLDGTLLPMDNDEFTRGYFKLLAAKLAPYGYEAGPLIDGIWSGVAAMVSNDGSRTNEEAFWARFAEVLGDRVFEHRPVLEEFYAVDFKAASRFCGFNPAAAETVRRARAMGLRTVLATNPIFPAVATESRIGWAGLTPGDFELYTTYENSRHSKPNADYYRDILSELGLSAGECLMVGNDADEDMAAGQTGMQVFLLTDCLINRENRSLDLWPHGGFAELDRYIESLV